ncbi:MAG: hypothetical protein RI957_2025 [Verrucomicrobiota bacterium]|jgi:spermidine/putrescine transport system ATP-binding protein
MSFLRFESVHKSFGAFRAVEDVSLSIDQGHIFSLLGPSGCGKTTLLRMVAGFERPDHGRIYLDGKDITDLPPERRQVNTVFQHYALFPHLSVRENIAFGLKMAGHGKESIRTEVDRMLHVIDLEAHADKRIPQISGGQKQRVAIARALVNRPQVLLLDEPLAALDLKLRQHLLAELHKIHEEVGITFIYVTHDQNEALSISDQIAVLHHGRLQQVGGPREIYEKPQNSFVAAFIGDTNFISGVVEEATDEMSWIRLDENHRIATKNNITLKQGREVHLSLRPENILLHPSIPDAVQRENFFPGIIEESTYHGSFTRCRVRCGAFVWIVDVSQRALLLSAHSLALGARVWLEVPMNAAILLDSYDAHDECMEELLDEIPRPSES